VVVELLAVRGLECAFHKVRFKILSALPTGNNNPTAKKAESQPEKRRRPPAGLSARVRIEATGDLLLKGDLLELVV
jgi:hypothetical protein